MRCKELFKHTTNFFLRLLFTLFLSTSLLHAANVEKMKNLELKLELDQKAFSHLKWQLEPYYAETLYQTDTYFLTNEDRLKLREEKGKEAYLIRYQRPDLEEAKESSYIFYPVKDVSLFLSVLGDCLIQEIQVKKERALYFPEPHIRIHLDQVEQLGDFLEIEIILSKNVPLSVAEKQMQDLQEWLQLNRFNKIDCGYRELLQKMLVSGG